MDRTGPACASADETRSAEALVRKFEHRVGFFAAQVAREFMLGSRWRDELESAGYWGLAKALANRRESASDRELSAYVSQCVRGAILDEGRRCLRHTRVVDVSASAAGSYGGGRDLENADWIFGRHLAALGGTPEEITGAQRLRERVEEALEMVEPDDRALLRAYMSGFSVAEIARREGLPQGTVRARFDRILRRLRGRGSPVRRMDLHAAG